MLPPKKGVRGRKQQTPRAMRAYKPPDELDNWIEEEVTRRGLNRSGFVVSLLEFAKGVQVGLGDEWYELARRAAVEQVEPGDIAAKLLKSALKK